MSASSVAKALAAAELDQWARTTFPGVELFDAEHTEGARGIHTHRTGRWQGVYLEFAHWASSANGGPHASVCLHCQCCGRFAPHFNHRAVTSVAEFATEYPSDPPTEVERCFDCEWLHAAQKAAEKTRSRLARWRFVRTRGQRVEDVLGRHRPAA